MEDKQHKLDDFLRSRLNNDAEDSSWNVPDDYIFEAAMRTVAADKKKKRRPWIIIPFMLLAGWMGSEYMHNNQIKTLQHKVDVMEQSILNPPQQKESISSYSYAADSQFILQTQFSSPKEPNIQFSRTSKRSATQNLSNITSTNILLSRTNTAFSNTTIPAASMQPSLADSTTAHFSIATLQRNKQETEVPSHLSLPGSLSLPIRSLPIYGLLILESEEIKIDLPSHTISVPERVSTTLPLRYGILLSTNQSWYTMKKIPFTPDARLYAYENSQPGVGLYGFIRKPLSPRLSLQSDFGYHIYKNKSVLENQFLFDMKNVVETTGGESIYQTDLELMNPLGDYNAMIEFRVNDQMQDNDLLQEYSKNKQVLHTLNLGLSLQYALIRGKRVTISLGTGFSLGYCTRLQNEFNVSVYHNTVLQTDYTALPTQLNNVRSVYAQALGKLSFEYRPSDRFGFIVESQYGTGITSLRKGITADGPHTYLHAVMVSAGITHGF